MKSENFLAKWKALSFTIKTLSMAYSVIFQLGKDKLRCCSVSLFVLWNVYFGRMSNSETAVTVPSLMTYFRIYIFLRSPVSTLNFIECSGFLYFSSYFVIDVDFCCCWYLFAKTVVRGNQVRGGKHHSHAPHWT